MITKFMTVYPGHIDMPDLGQDATPANERNFGNAELASVFDKLEAIARQMDRCGWDTLWLAEHHFQHEGYEVLPNILSVVMVEVGLRFTYSILIIAGMSFLGFGLQPPTPNWGLMINENRIGLVVNPWAVVVPASLIAILTIGLNTFTDAVARASLGVDRPVDEVAAVTGIPLELEA